MPNEFEPKERLPWTERLSGGLSSLIENIRVRITWEEILLIAIILLLLFESRDEEILIVLFIYILLF
jgi:hypothetical protein